MSDLRLTAVCAECVDAWISGTSTLQWTNEHLDMYPDHRVTVTRSGRLPGLDD